MAVHLHREFRLLFPLDIVFTIPVYGFPHHVGEFLAALFQRREPKNRTFLVNFLAPGSDLIVHIPLGLKIRSDIFVEEPSDLCLDCLAPHSLKVGVLDVASKQFSLRADIPLTTSPRQLSTLERVVPPGLLCRGQFDDLLDECCGLGMVLKSTLERSKLRSGGGALRDHRCSSPQGWPRSRHDPASFPFQRRRCKSGVRQNQRERPTRCCCLPTSECSCSPGSDRFSLNSMRCCKPVIRSFSLPSAFLSPAQNASSA